jgi:hypothetical protein
MQITTVVSGHRAKRDALGSGQPGDPSRRTNAARKHLWLDRVPKNPRSISTLR